MCWEAGWGVLDCLKNTAESRNYWSSVRLHLHWICSMNNKRTGNTRKHISVWAIRRNSYRYCEILSLVWARYVSISSKVFISKWVNYSVSSVRTGDVSIIQKCPYYGGVRIYRESVVRGSTVFLNALNLIQGCHPLGYKKFPDFSLTNS